MSIRRGTTFTVESASNQMLVDSKVVVCRLDRNMGFFWVLSLTLMKKDEAYRDIEFGPYCAADIPAGRLKRAKHYVPPGLLIMRDEIRGQFKRKPKSTA